MLKKFKKSQRIKRYLRKVAGFLVPSLRLKFYSFIQYLGFSKLNRFFLLSYLLFINNTLVLKKQDNKIDNFLSLYIKKSKPITITYGKNVNLNLLDNTILKLRLLLLLRTKVDSRKYLMHFLNYKNSFWGYVLRRGAPVDLFKKEVDVISCFKEFNLNYNYLMLNYNLQFFFPFYYKLFTFYKGRRNIIVQRRPNIMYDLIGRNFSVFNLWSRFSLYTMDVRSLQNYCWLHLQSFFNDKYSSRFYNYFKEYISHAYRNIFSFRVKNKTRKFSYYTHVYKSRRVFRLKRLYKVFSYQQQVSVK